MITDVTITTHGPASIIAAQELEERQQKSATIEYSNFSDDTVTISQEAREMQKAAAGGQTESSKDDASRNSQHMNAERNTAVGVTEGSVASAGAAKTEQGKAVDDELASLEKQIEQVKQKLEKAREKLEELKAEEQSGSSGGSEKTVEGDTTPLTEGESTEQSASERQAAPLEAPPQLEESPAVKTVQSEITQLNAQLTMLQQQRNTALKAKGGGGGPSDVPTHFAQKKISAQHTQQVWTGASVT